jgi:hypothetical protein
LRRACENNLVFGLPPAFPVSPGFHILFLSLVLIDSKCS